MWQAHPDHGSVTNLAICVLLSAGLLILKYCNIYCQWHHSTFWLMERIISAAIYRHLQRNTLLSCTQHGFIRGKSTCTNLLEALNDWTLAVQNRHRVCVAYIDFSKAFDTVSHEKLFRCLYSYGIRGDVLRWITGLGTFLQVERNRPRLGWHSRN